MEYLDLVLVAVLTLLVLLLLAFLTGEREGFDSYFNHDFGAAGVYGTSDIDWASLYSRYAWGERDPLGYQVYDWYYNGVLRERNSEDPGYAYREIGAAGEENVYDSRFQVLDGENLLATYAVRDMLDRNPATRTLPSGEVLYLAQKNY